MRKITFVLFMLFTLTFHAQWIQQTSGTGETLNDVYCITADVVFAAGNGGVILKTADGGQNWVQKTSGTINSLMKVQFADANTGYAAGHNGTLLKTIDGGETWTTIDSGTAGNLYGLSVLDPFTFFISGDDGLIRKTEDGGTTFATRDAPQELPVLDVQFITALSGYARAEQLLKTLDGGSTWTVLPVTPSAFHFADEQTGYINYWEGGISKTIDGAANFTAVNYSIPHVSDIFSTEAGTIWTVEDVGNLCWCPGFCITKIIEDGDNYDSVSDCGLGGNFGDPFAAIYFANETTGFAVGAFGQIFKNPTGIALGTENIGKSSTITLYPNPASEQFTISLKPAPAEKYNVAIYDILGKTVFTKSYLHESSATVNTSALTAGLYFVTISSDGKKQTQKIVIN